MSYLRQNSFEDLSDLYYAVSDLGADLSPTSRLFQEATTNETSAGGVDWDVSNCCGKYETIFLSCMAAYLIIIGILWKTILLKPMKLITVFIHGTFLNPKVRY